MRPIKVEFQAFGPYVGYEKVDFETLSSKGLFLICGKTGIGKTMILDAITFALFGKSSGHGRDNFEAMRCTNAEFNTDTFVKFEFENRGEYYLFERRLERKRKNLSSEYNVSRKDDNGIWQPLMENAKYNDINEKAVEIIGLEYEQFRQVIILPQGQFERLLTSNSEEKEKILTSIFGEDKWQAIATHFYADVEKRKNELKKIQEKIHNSLAEENCDSISQLEHAVSLKHNRIEALEEDYKKKNYEAIISEQHEKLSLADRFTALHEAEAEIDKLNLKKDERNAWERALNDAKRADRVRTLFDSEKRESDKFEFRKKAEKSVSDDAEMKKELFDRASEKYSRHVEKEGEIEKLNEKKIHFEGKREDYEGLEEAENALEKKKKEVSLAENEESAADNNKKEIEKKIKELQDEYEALQNEHKRLLDLYLAGITGELANKLEAGKPCPVCGSVEHPHKAQVTVESVTKDMVDSKNEETENKYSALRKCIDKQGEAQDLLKEKHNAVETLRSEEKVLFSELENKKKSLIEGISTVGKLEDEISRIEKIIGEYDRQKNSLQEAKGKAQTDVEKAASKVESAKEETRVAEAAYKLAENDLEKGLRENGFTSREKAKELMLNVEKMDELFIQITKYDTDVKNANDNMSDLKDELTGKEEPDKEKCREIIDNTNELRDECLKNLGVLKAELNRLEEKVENLRKEGEGIEEKINEADEDLMFAKKLRGDSGTGLQRYVLGIMFSSVVAAANKMLEMVHGGRYRLYRSDEKAQGTNKRGLELKVFDKNSEEHDGRFVSTLSGGEKFLVSLALSIGMSTVAQKSGIKIEALFIDEGFGSLDDDSINDAMAVLNSIQEANGLVGIISHVQILQDQIPSKLRVEADREGSHIIQTVG